MLQPSAPINMSRTSFLSAVATLSVPVNVSAMIRPKMTSETRSTGVNTGAATAGARAEGATEIVTIGWRRGAA